VSEYQYYDFLAVDRPLSDEEMRELRRISTRAEITRTRFSNEYNWGDLKADPSRLLARYFDVHVYVANWGTHRLLIRLPVETLASEVPDAYCRCDSVGFAREGDNVLIDFGRDDEEAGGEWESGSGWMATLSPIRAELMRGDLRALYLAWLGSIQYDEPDDDEILEPPVPAGLGQLTTAQESLIEFLSVDEHLVRVAAEASTTAAAGTEGLADWVRSLDPAEKDRLLVSVVEGSESQIGAALMRRFRAGGPLAHASNTRMCRTVAALLEAARLRREAEERRRAEQAAEEQRRHDEAAAVERARYLNVVGSRRDVIWTQVEGLIESKTPKGYDAAVRFLVDLRDEAGRRGDAPSFAQRMDALRTRHSQKPSFLARLGKVGLR
jgi:hypothetical protein